MIALHEAAVSFDVSAFPDIGIWLEISASGSIRRVSTFCTRAGFWTSRVQ